jgi:hypothetical protein
VTDNPVGIQTHEVLGIIPLLSFLRIVELIVRKSSELSSSQPRLAMSIIPSEGFLKGNI